MDHTNNPILIVDDDAFQRRMIRIKLQTRGYEVNEAKDGVEALSFLEEQGYSLVLLDIVMPQLNGWEVLEQIRGRFPVEELPVIMMTARDNSYDPGAAKKRGATDYLTKPIDFASLDERIDHFLRMNASSGDTTDLPEETTNDEPDAATPPPVSHEDTASMRTRPVHSLLDGLVRNMPGVFFRAIGDSEHNVHISFQSAGLDTFLGKSWRSVAAVFASLEKHDRREVNRQFRDHSESLIPILMRFPCRGADDKVGWIECRATPQRLPSGETLWDAVLMDITGQKELELNLIRARESAGSARSSELLPLLELYRRHYRALHAGHSPDELAACINEMEAGLAKPAPAGDAGHEACEAPDASAEAAYRDENGFIHQCAQCRKVYNRRGGGQWELVAEWTHSMPLKTIHTICEGCAEAEDLLSTS